MSVFQDKVYKEMDWLSQVTEPYQLPILTALSQIPDVVDVSYKTLIDMCSSSWSERITSDCVIISMFTEVCRSLDCRNNRYALRQLASCFVVAAEDNTWFDFDEGKLHGKITMIKTKESFSDIECKQMLLESVQVLNNIQANHTKCKRIKTVLEIMGLPLVNEDFNFENIRNTEKESPWAVRAVLMKKINQVILEDRIRFRTMVAAESFMLNIVKYVQNEEEAGLANIMRVVITARNNQPIYLGDEA